MISVLYDGWPLAYHPDSPAALHLLALLEARPAGFPATVALPAASFHPLPEGTTAQPVPAPDTEWGRLRWEQRLLPGLAEQQRSGLVHLVGGNAALFGQRATVASPAGFPAAFAASPGPRPSFAARLRDALGQGGSARLRARLWPSDLPAPPAGAPLRQLPPAVHSLFYASQTPPVLPAAAAAELDSLHLPEASILYHGPGDERALRSLLAAWSWAAPSIGSDNPLLLVGLDSTARTRLEAILDEYHLAGTVRSLPLLSLPALAALYHTCSAVIHPVEASPWGDAARLALAAGRPLVGLETPFAAALAGPAAYLVPLVAPQPAGKPPAQDGTASLAVSRWNPSVAAPDHRALGAALITVIVEDSLAQALSDAAHQRVASWSVAQFAGQLEETYRQLTTLS